MICCVLCFPIRRCDLHLRATDILCVISPSLFALLTGSFYVLMVMLLFINYNMVSVQRDVCELVSVTVFGVSCSMRALKKRCLLLRLLF